MSVSNEDYRDWSRGAELEIVERWFSMRHGGTWSLNTQVEKFGPILISKGNNIFRGYEFFFFKGRLMGQWFVFNKEINN